MRRRPAPHRPQPWAAPGWFAEAEAWLPALEATGRLPCIDAATWLSGEETAALAAAVPRLLARCEPPGRLARAWELALPLGALHHAISYRSVIAGLEPPIDLHMAQSTAWWLRQVLAGLRPAPGR